jgi:hypothetical protein
VSDLHVVRVDLPSESGECSQREVHEYTVKLVLSTVQGGITLISKLLGGGGWGSV